MIFNIPKKKYMNNLADSVKRLYKQKLYKVVANLGVRIFFVTDNDESFIAVFDTDEHRIDIFSGEEGFLTCHFFLSGDNRGIRTFGVTNYTIEETTLEGENYCGRDYYLENFKHHEPAEDLYVIYYSNKPGQKAIVLEEDEVIEVDRYLAKLLLIIKKLKDTDEAYDQDTVCVCDFGSSKTDFEVDYLPLNSIDFLPRISTDLKDDNNIFGLEKIAVKPGVMHMGMIYGFNTYDSYDNLTEFEVSLTPIIIYAITEDGDFEHIIFSTPYKRRIDVSNVILCKLFERIGIYDTVVIDNLFIYQSLCAPLGGLGVEVKFDLANPANEFITKFMIKMIDFNSDIAIVDEALNNCKKDIKELFLSSKDDLEELNERFFAEDSDEPIIEEVIEDEEEIDEDDEFFNSDSDGFVS